MVPSALSSCSTASFASLSDFGARAAMHSASLVSASRSASPSVKMPFTRPAPWASWWKFSSTNWRLYTSTFSGASSRQATPQWAKSSGDRRTREIVVLPVPLLPKKKLIRFSPTARCGSAP